MTKPLKQPFATFDKKLQACTDELSFLLDLIYKYPQQQRQKYYDRIQLLKQNLTHMKMCLNDNQPSTALATLQKKYQQVYMKINQLKGQINSYQFQHPNKKKKTNLNDITPLFVQPNINSSVPKSNKVLNRSQYDSIMQTIVQKQQQLKKYKTECLQSSKIIKQYQQKQQQTKTIIQILQQQLSQIRNANKLHFDKIQELEIQVKNKDQVIKQLQESNRTQKLSNQLIKQQVLNLRILLQQTQNNLKLKKDQADTYAIQLAAFEQKYKYDSKLHTQRQQMGKIKQRNYEKKLSELQKQILALGDVNKSNKDLLLQNVRLKQDVKVFQAQLTIKQQHLYQKNRKIETYKNQITQLKQNIQQVTRTSQQKQQCIQKLLQLEKQNRNILELFQKKIRQLEIITAQLEQKNLVLNKKIKDTELVNKQMESKIKNKDQQIKKVQNLYKKCQQNCSNSDQNCQKLQKQLDKCKLQLAKSQKKLTQINAIITKLEQQRNDLYLKLQISNRETGEKQQSIKNYQKQIQNLKKRLLRAKIQSIHNLRQVLL